MLEERDINPAQVDDYFNEIDVNPDADSAKDVIIKKSNTNTILFFANSSLANSGILQFLREEKNQTRVKMTIRMMMMMMMMVSLPL